MGQRARAGGRAGWSGLRVAALALAAFGCDASDPPPTPAKAVRALTLADATGIAGQSLSGGITVRVVDYSDRGLSGIKVRFTSVVGDGSVATSQTITDGEGVAHTEWTLGPTAGDNVVLASVFGISADSNATFSATGEPGPAIRIAMTPGILRIPPTTTTGSIAARVVDQFGNEISPATSYLSRDLSVATVSSSGQVSVSVNNRGTSTWLVASGAGFIDSARVYNLSDTDPPCTGITAMAPLAVGEVKTTGFFDNGICVPAATGEREYALVPFFDSPVPSAQTVFQLSGVGVKATQSAALGTVRPLTRRPAGSFERRLRLMEREELTSRAADVRRWFASRTAKASFATTAAKVGDEFQLNVRADSFCTAPIWRTGRVAAISQKAVVLADVANPAGYTDADYTSFAASFDTIAFPVDIANFGAPTDVDGNGRVLIFFTHAVNEAGFGILGYASARDLLPKSGPLGACVGSNVAEIVYVRVPDGAFPPSSARLDVVATFAHEFQHIINAGRRLFLNPNANPTEEVWLNEGLSHIAEELAFYRASGFSPRQNLGSQLTGSQAFLQFASRNFDRYYVFTSDPGSRSPVGLTDLDDDIQTRGAVWSFLRFAADQRAASDETALWQGLVNANSAGLQNLYDNLGTDARVLMRDWAISNFIDGLVPIEGKYSQLSWNLREVPGFQAPSVLALVASGQTTPTTASTTVTLRALASEFVRFGVGSDQEAFVSAAGFPASSNVPLPRNVLLALVRTK